MTDPTASPQVSEYLRALKPATRSVVSMLFVVALLVGIGSYIGKPGIDGLRTLPEYTVTVKDEYLDQVLTGGRRTKRWVDARFVHVVKPDGSIGSVRSDTLRIGETATVWEYPETGKLVEEKPGISWPLLLFGSFFLLIGLATASGLVRSLRAPSVARHRLREAVTGRDATMIPAEPGTSRVRVAIASPDFPADSVWEVRPAVVGTRPIPFPEGVTAPLSAWSYRRLGWGSHALMRASNGTFFVAQLSDPDAQGPAEQKDNG